MLYKLNNVTQYLYMMLHNVYIYKHETHSSIQLCLEKVMIKLRTVNRDAFEILNVQIRFKRNCVFTKVFL